MWFPQMTGVPALHDGSGVFQTTFSVRFQVVGRLVALLIRFPLGPRHCGQFSCAWATSPDKSATRVSAKRTPCRFMRIPPACLRSGLRLGPLRDGDQVALRAEEERPLRDGWRRPPSFAGYPDLAHRVYGEQLER